MNKHALENDFASSNAHDLGRNINNDDEHTLKGIDIKNDPKRWKHFDCEFPDFASDS